MQNRIVGAVVGFWVLLFANHALGWLNAGSESQISNLEAQVTELQKKNSELQANKVNLEQIVVAKEQELQKTKLEYQYYQLGVSQSQ